MKFIRFLVSADPALYSPDAAEQEAQQFAAFAYEYLQKHGYDQVEIEFVQGYPAGSADLQAALREEIWSAYRAR